MVNLSAFIFISYAFVLTFALVFLKSGEWRGSFVSASLYFGAYAWGLAEFLGFFKILGLHGILFGWLLYISFMSVAISVEQGKNPFRLSLNFELRRECLFIGAVLLVAFFIAASYPPNNWDSMTYHLPRVEHWLQNKSMSHYYTSNARQVTSAPFAEMLLLHLRAMAGNDGLANFVQWFSFLGAIIVVSKIACRLGLGKAGQVSASLFFCTLPMAILQSSSTQNDLVEAFWLVCMAERFLAWKERGTWKHGVDFGLSLALAILTKGTGYVMAFPFVACFAVLSLKRYRKLLFGACLAALVFFALNLPHYVRNYVAFKDPISAHAGTVSEFSVKALLTGLVSNIFSNMDPGLPSEVRARLNEKLGIFEDALCLNEKIFPYGPPRFTQNTFRFHEDVAGNFLHMLFVICALPSVLYRGNGNEKFFAGLVSASWLMFFLCIPWQPWVTRLQVPLFALSSPVFSSFASYISTRRRGWALSLLACFALLPLFLNVSRPLLTSPSSSKRTIWGASREELLFANRRGLEEEYRRACDALIGSGAKKIGLVIGGDSWEYPLWWYYNAAGKPIPEIVHLKADLSADADALFIMDRDLSFLDGAVPNMDSAPGGIVLLKRDATSPSGWALLE
jgi:hypothetical protein